MIIKANDKKELASLLASVKESIINMYPDMEPEKTLQISRNLLQIADICKC